MIIVDFGIPVVFIQHIAVILAAYILVRDSQLNSSATLANDGQHAVIVEQTWEQVWVNQVFGRETFSQLSPDVTLVDDFFQHALAVALQLVQEDDLLHLGIISHGIWVNHLVRSFAKTDEMAEIIDNHIRFEHLWICPTSL